MIPDKSTKGKQIVSKLVMKDWTNFAKLTKPKL